MAAFDFPLNPPIGTLYPLVAEVGKPQYRWNGSEWTAATLDPAGYVRKSGDAMTGALSLAGDPTQALHAVPKQYLDAQRQRISLAGGKTFDIQVPTDAATVRLSGTLIPATAAACVPLISISVVPGVFVTAGGAYITNGFYQISNLSSITGVSLTTYSGIVISTGHENANSPITFDGQIVLKRQSTAAIFQADFRAVSYSVPSGGFAHSFLFTYMTQASVNPALSVLALRLTSTSSDNWMGNSYLNVEWL